MNNFWEILFIVAIIGFQSFAGYLGNKYVGAILPVVFSLIEAELDLVLGNDITSPVAIHEMEKMKAKDHISQ